MSSSICSRAIKGWLAGCGAATAVICAFILALLAMGSRGDLIRFVVGGLILLFPAVLIFAVTCVMSGIPAALVIWLSEKFAIRSILFFGCAGSVTGALSQEILMGTVTPSDATRLFVVAGFVAGIAYWRIAGRHAGLYREISRDSA
jgi:hypothetical protein